MFSVKVLNREEKKHKEFIKTINNIVSYVFDKLNFNDIRMISDDTSVEIVSGKESSNNEDVIVELLIRKNIIINNHDFNDRKKLDEHITKIKHFCEQAKSIEDLQYLPINMR